MHAAILWFTLVLRWALQLPSAVVAPPAPAGTSAVVADTAGFVYALDRNTGAVNWKTRLQNGIWSAPVVFRDRVLVSTGDPQLVALQPPAYALAGAGPSDIVALDQRSGIILWESDLVASGAPGLAIASGLLVHHDGSGEVLAADALSGSYRWRTFVAATAAQTTAVAVGANRVATSGAYPNRVIVLRTRDGAILHRIDFPPDALGFAQAKILAVGSRLYGTYLLPRHVPIERLYAIDADSGRLLWDVAIGEGAGFEPLPELAYARGLLYAGSPFRPAMDAFDASSGKRVWEASLHGESLGGVAQQAQRLYLADSAGWITVLDAATGAQVDAAQFGGDMSVSTPAVLGNSLIVGSRTGLVRSISTR